MAAAVEHCDLPVWELLVLAGLGRLMDGSGWSAGAASSGVEFQTVHWGFVLIFVFTCFVRVFLNDRPM